MNDPLRDEAEAAWMLRESLLLLGLTWSHTGRRRWPWCAARTHDDAFELRLLTGALWARWDDCTAFDALVPPTDPAMHARFYAALERAVRVYFARLCELEAVK